MFSEKVIDDYHGVSVSDPFRLLETDADPSVCAWTEQQNARTRSFLDSLPIRASIRERLQEVLTSSAQPTYRELTWRASGGFALKSAPDRQQPVLVSLSPDFNPSTERLILDPIEFLSDQTATINWYAASFDGKYIAVSLSRSGDETGDLYIFDAHAGVQIDDVIPHVMGGTAGGDAVWAANNSDLYYTRYPAPEERAQEDACFFQQVYRHTLSTAPDNDAYVFGEGLPRTAQIRLSADPRANRICATVQHGDSGRFAHFLKQENEVWVQLSDFDDDTLQVCFGPGRSVYAVSKRDAPNGCVLRLCNDDPGTGPATLVIPENEQFIPHSFYTPKSPSMLVTDTRIYLLQQSGGPMRLCAYDLEGAPSTAPAHSDIASLSGLTHCGGDDIIFMHETFVTPGEWRRFDAHTGATRKLAISTEPSADFSDIDVRREVAVSTDGAIVPVTLLIPKCTPMDGTAPLLAYGYGGFGFSLTPQFKPQLRALFDHGVIYAAVNLRGGGEFGEAWRESGRRTHKQNVFDDFASVIRRLVERQYAAPDRIAITGASNGGLLMGATMVQHPQLIQAVVSHVGIYDMLRMERSANGAFTAPEYGSVKNREEFEALYAYSPYHNIRDGETYPPVLLMTGENDTRVAPMQSKKFAARLQEAQGGNAPVYLLTDPDAGHGTGEPLNARIEKLADEYAFILSRLNLDDR